MNGEMEQEDGKTGRFGDGSEAVIGACMPIHNAQLLTYLRLTTLGTGLLVNFRETVLKNGLRRLTLTPSFPSSRLPGAPGQA
jgi:hypothetical protein